MKARFALVFIVLSASASPVWADNLDEDIITRWAATMAPLKAWGAEHAAALKDTSFGRNQFQLGPGAVPNDDNIEALRRPFTSGAEAVEEAGLSGGLQAILNEQDFYIDEWADYGDRIMRAYIANQLEAQNADPLAMEAAIVELENSPYATGDQVERLRASLAAMKKILEVMRDVPEADKSAVRPHRSLIERALGPP